jgi:hypothetical protein
MCTVVVDFDPAQEIALLILAVRDEMLGRPWIAPGRHWPEFPELTGGKDLVAGGTWLAVHEERRRAGFVLNGKGTMAPEPGRLSRGELPLLAAQGLPLPEELPLFDPFHLVSIGLSGGLMSSWDGESLRQQEITPGRTVIVNSGVDAGEPRAARLLSTLAGVRRPDPRQGWGDWLPLAAGEGVPREDPAALIMRHTFGDDLRYGSSSVTLLGLSDSFIRYDFAAVGDEPGDLRLETIS